MFFFVCASYGGNSDTPVVDLIPLGNQIFQNLSMIIKLIMPNFYSSVSPPSPARLRRFLTLESMLEFTIWIKGLYSGRAGPEGKCVGHPNYADTLGYSYASPPTLDLVFATSLAQSYSRKTS